MIYSDLHQSIHSSKGGLSDTCHGLWNVNISQITFIESIRANVFDISRKNNVG